MTGYMAEMRKLVGHRVVIQCAAGVLCVDKNGSLLLGRRSDDHTWGYAGGSAEVDERAEDCARRELYEEMGVTADSLEFFCVNSGPETHFIYPNGDEVSNFEIVYLCREWHGDPKPVDGEMEDLRFVPIGEIDLDSLMSPNRAVIAEYIHRVKRDGSF